jgi:hypothetical protein
MARMKQTAKKSTGSKASVKQLDTKAHCKQKSLEHPRMTQNLLEINLSLVICNLTNLYTRVHPKLFVLWLLWYHRASHSWNNPE